MKCGALGWQQIDLAAPPRSLSLTNPTQEFSQELQEQFAALTGDRNPMHMDAVAARRTQAGMPVVHGVHTLLWALNAAAQAGVLTVAPHSLRAKFQKWVYVGGSVRLELTPGAEGAPKELRAMFDDMTVVSVGLKYGETAAWPETNAPVSPETPLPSPAVLSFAEAAGSTGSVYTGSSGEAEAMFPALCRLVGARAVAEVAACSYLVGMVTPGLHSMFTRADLTLRAGHTSTERKALPYAVKSAREEFRWMRLTVAGEHVQGALEAFLRPAPKQQAKVEDLRRQVQPGEFAAVRALIVGGSRGLGELSAKLIAAGGGASVITYAVGATEADAVATEIRATGAESETLRYDVRAHPAEQLAALQKPFTHMLYFATNPIFRPKGELVHRPFLEAFAEFYLHGFYELCKELLRTGAAYATPEGATLRVYYPSSVAVEDRPEGMTEYAMIKAAGEVMCADMGKFLPGLHILTTRLPRLPTDQTMSVAVQEETDPVTVLLPVLRQLVS